MKTAAPVLEPPSVMTRCDRRLRRLLPSPPSKRDQAGTEQEQGGGFGDVRVSTIWPPSLIPKAWVCRAPGTSIDVEAASAVQKPMAGPCGIAHRVPRFGPRH